MSKSFSHAGVSKLDGKFKVRFCNDALRTKVLQKNGHTDIDIVELKHPMTKPEIVEYLLSIDFDNGNTAVRAAIEAEQGKRTEKPAKAAAVPTAKKTAAKKAKSTPSMDAIKAKATAKVKAEAKVDISKLEDAPF
jgi:hypothetical protein